MIDLQNAIKKGINNIEVIPEGQNLLYYEKILVYLK